MEEFSFSTPMLKDDLSLEKNKCLFFQLERASAFSGAVLGAVEIVGLFDVFASMLAVVAVGVAVGFFVGAAVGIFVGALKNRA